MRRKSGSLLLWLCIAHAPVAAAEWRTVTGPAAALASWDGYEVGASARNPFIDVAVDGLRGHWVRFSGEVDKPQSQMQFWLTAFRNDSIATKSAPTRCIARESGRAHCSGVLWVPPQTTRLRLVVWAHQAPGHIHDVRFEAADAGPPEALDARVAGLIDLVQQRYYRSQDVDWPALRAEFAAIPRAPGDIDPLPTLAQLLRDRLPGNRHTSVRLVSTVDTPAAEIALPACRKAAQDVWMLRLPGAAFIDDVAVRRYVAAARRCVEEAPPIARWIVDLRENDGGNMLPMLAALGEFFPAGPLVTFLDGHGTRIGIASLSASGIVQDGQLVAAYPTQPGLRAAAPVVAWINASCGSSCEVVAIAFRGRSGTRLVGQASAGLTTGNAVYPINDDYRLLLTESYMGDRCGRAVPERIAPDVAIDPKDDAAAIAQLRAIEVAQPAAAAPCGDD